MADENVSVVQPFVPTREQVSVIAKDPELRKLRPASPEYQAAIEKKFPKDGAKPAESAPAVKVEKDETNKEVSAQTEASDEKTTVEDDDALLAKASAAAQRRISELIAEKKSFKARIAELEKSGKTPAQAEKQATAEAKAEPTTFDKPKPKLGDFKNLEDYNEAYFDWRTEKREAEQEQKSKAKAAQESSAKNFNAFLDEGKKLEKEMGLNEGDFETLVNDVDGIKTFPVTKQAIIESPFGARIAMELANLDDAERSRVEKMTPVQQVAYVGKLEAKFEAKKQTTETQTVSAAKAPGKPLKKGSGGVSVTAITPGMGFKAYEAARKAQQPNKFRR